MAKPATASRARRKSFSAPDSRSKLIIAIRAACRRKGLDDDDRRELQREATGKASLSDMTPAELGRFLDHLNRDWTGPADNGRAHLGKIRALWWSLYWLGEIGRPDDEALTTFVKRQTDIEHLRFLDHMKAPSVIEALKAWLERAGVTWELEPSPVYYERLASERGHRVAITPQHVDRHCVLLAIGKALDRRMILKSPAFYDWVEHWLGGPQHCAWAMSPSQLDAAIREFGKKLRRAIDAEAQR